MGGFPLAAGSLLISGGCVAFVSVRVSRWLAGADDTLVRCLVGLVATWAQIALVLQVLGAGHILYPAAVVVAHVVLAAASWRLLPGGVRSTGGPATLPAVITIAAVSAFVAYWAVYSGGAPSGEFDTNRYHIVNVAHWFSSHETWSLPFAQPSDHTAVEPGNGELLSLWLMLPFGDDRLAYATNLGAFVLIAVACAALVRELGGRAWAGGVAALAIIGSPLVTTAFPHSMLTDLWGAGAIAAVPALGLASARLHSPRLLVLAGACAGLAAGTKYVDVLPALGVLGLVGWVTRPRLRPAVAAGVAAVATCGFWYLRNAVATGNPVYPQTVRIAGTTLLPGDDSPVSESRVSLVGQLAGSGRVALAALRDTLSTNALPAVLLLAAAVLFVCVRRLRPKLGRGAVLAPPAWLLVACALCVAAYALTPYSGGGDPPTDLYMNAGARFLLPAMLLVAVAAAVALPPIATVVVTVVAVAARADLLIHGSGDRADLAFRPVAAVVAVLAGVAVVAGVWLAGRGMLREVRARAALAACLGALAVAACASVSPAPAGTLASVDAQRPGSCACVVLVNVPDVRAVLAPAFTLPIRSVGVGDTEGARREILDPATLMQAIGAIRPAVVIVGDDVSAMPRAAWSPPAEWRVIGRDAGAVAYAPPVP